MPKRFANGSISVRACQVLAGVALLSMAPRAATAAPVEAFVELLNCGTVIDRGPIAASGSNTGQILTGTCANPGAEAAGGASFTDGTISLTMTSIPQRGVSGRAYLNDNLTFHVPGGGSAQVQVSVAGGWGGTYDFSVNANFKVGLALGLDATLYQGYGYANLAFDDGLPVSDAFTGTDIGGGVILGSYFFTTTWTVYDGVVHDLFAQLQAEATEGATSYIDDPLIITLPAGVTFSSVSGRTYTAVPEPSTLLLLGAGLLVAVRQRIKARA